MKTLCKLLVFAALGTLCVPTTARAQSRSGGGARSVGGPRFDSGRFRGDRFGLFGLGGLGFGFPFGYGGYPYGGYGGYPYGGFGGYPYGGFGGNDYGSSYASVPTFSATYIVPVLYTASTATAPPRMRATEYPAIAYRDTQFEGTKAFIDVHLPAAGAQVWIDGVSMKQTGVERRFITPSLDPEATYTLEVRASWTAANGKEETRAQRIDVRAGAHQSVAFLP